MPSCRAASPGLGVAHASNADAMQTCPLVMANCGGSPKTSRCWAWRPKRKETDWCASGVEGGQWEQGN